LTMLKLKPGLLSLVALWLSWGGGAISPGGTARAGEGANRIGERELLVIVPDHLASAWAPFVEWRNRFGTPTGLVTVGQIESSTAGVDRPERIRTFIRGAHQTVHTQWFLLGGDSDTLPPRMVACSAFNAAERATLKGPIATDLYYGDLDGTWDQNGNGVYGEPTDQCDLMPDVYVGRVPARTASEVTAWFEKLKAYEGATQKDYQDRVLLLGEKVASFLGQAICSSLALERSVAADLPEWVRVTRLYDPGCMGAGPEYRSMETQFDTMNAGHNLVLNYGHGMWDWLGSLRLFHLEQFTNFDRPGIYMTTECNGCEFTHPMIPHVACEAYVLSKGGGVAYLGNTEFGVGMPWLMYFYDLLMKSLFDLPQVSLGQHVAAALRQYGTPEELMRPLSDQRWQQFVLVLMGDPSMVVRTRIPAYALLEQVVSSNATTTTHRYRVLRSAEGIAGARVTIFKAGEYLYVATTGPDGVAEFRWTGTGPSGQFTVSATSPEILPIVKK